ncbi:N-acetylmuramidase domain-containing protein [Glaciimonas soli]|uniref:DUF3380 domain-containing protein n=1 Tax=Glaciimonas soli TaxID=2590999 RepID=A0A843YQQ4_9BURK|nr:N-acetylmuramidase domain-containing protein [Glaciimonas soli]MQR02099.1 DUF3380 domain-containing protein [Glaciimonas soli]
MGPYESYKYPGISSENLYIAGTAKDKDRKRFDDGNHYDLFSWQYVKLVKAYALDQDAALTSCSWGKHQVMGENYETCGFSNVKDFVKAMSRSEKEHLKALVGFCKGNNLQESLKSKNWSAIARAYNGPKYKKNNYDTELEAHYAKFVSEKGGKND